VPRRHMESNSNSKPLQKENFYLRRQAAKRKHQAARPSRRNAHESAHGSDSPKSSDKGGSSSEGDCNTERSRSRSLSSNRSKGRSAKGGGGGTRASRNKSLVISGISDSLERALGEVDGLKSKLSDIAATGDDGSRPVAGSIPDPKGPATDRPKTMQNPDGTVCDVSKM